MESLTGAAHERLQTAPRLDGLAIVGGVFEEDLCQPGQCLLPRFRDRVQAGIGIFLGLIQFFDLSHCNGTRPAFGAQWFRQELSRA